MWGTHQYTADGLVRLEKENQFSSCSRAFSSSHGFNGEEANDEDVNICKTSKPNGSTGEDHATWISRSGDGLFMVGHLLFPMDWLNWWSWQSSCFMELHTLIFPLIQYISESHYHYIIVFITIIVIFHHFVFAQKKTNKQIIHFQELITPPNPKNPPLQLQFAQNTFKINVNYSNVKQNNVK